MKSLIVSILFLSSLYAIDFNKNYGNEFNLEESFFKIQPFISLDYNNVAIEKVGLGDSNAISLSVGWVLNQDSKFLISSFRGKKKINADDNIKFENIILLYEHSLKNFSNKQGLYLGGGIAKNNFRSSTKPDDINGTEQNATISTYHQLDIVAKVGYEYKVNNNYIYDISFNTTLLPLNKSKDSVNSNMYYARFSVKYIFSQY